MRTRMTSDQRKPDVHQPSVISSSGIRRVMSIIFLCRMVKNDQDVIINNKDVFFNNIIDTIEIFKFIQYILKNDVPFNISFNFSASSPIRLEGLILGIKKYFNSKSNINFSKVPTNHFIISNEAFTNNFDYEVSTTQKIVKRYLKSIN